MIVRDIGLRKRVGILARCMGVLGFEQNDVGLVAIYMNHAHLFVFIILSHNKRDLPPLY
jgi:hypothetical protein